MYSFGHDFDYNTDIDGLIYNYISNIKNINENNNKNVYERKPVYRRLDRDDIIYSRIIRQYCMD